MELLKASEKELRSRYISDMDEIRDVTSEALERLLDYFQRKPEKFLEIEEKDQLEMVNYLKKSVRNHVLNILKKRGRQKKKHDQLIKDPVEFFLHDLPAEMPVNGNPAATGDSGEEVDWSDLSLGKIRDELYLFIQEKYGRAKGKQKKEIIDLYLERLEGNLSLKDLQAKYPHKKIASLNTECHRLLKSYQKWVRQNQKSLLFKTLGDDDRVN